MAGQRNRIEAANVRIICASLVAVALAQQAHAQSVTVPAGQTVTLTSNPSTGVYEVGTNATLTSALSATISTTATTVTVVNDGTISTSNPTGRAINLAGPNNARDIVITNNAGATIQSADDAVRVNFNPTGGAITVSNAGLIRTTAGGQAIDFDAAASGSGTILINNLATGELRSFGQDGIRPGQGATVNNAGLIFSDGPANNNYDGVDWQNKAGVVNNLGTGTISGLRHGITSDVDVSVVNAGAITGRNGSGIGSDGTGTVTNTGTITGRWDGIATNGDGDGVDIDLIGTVVNSGTIQGLTATGVDSGGRPNSAQGVAMGGGSITNTTGGTIFGGAQGVLINLDTNPGGAAVGATTIVNAGTIRGGSAEAIQFVGAFNDSITTSGAIIGGNGVAIDMGGGDDRLTILNGATFTGRVDGGAGTDTVVLGGTGGIFGAVANFEALLVTGTGWSLSQPTAFANGLSIAAGGSLTGNSFTLGGAILNNGTLIVDQAQDGAFGPTLSGAGALVKTGAGSLMLGTQAGYTGAITVAAGRLGIAGTVSSQILVQSGATLGGNGAVGATSLATGGIIAPGDSIGTLTVNGAFSAAAGSTYAAETTGAGLSDLIVVNGAATLASGARLAVSRDGAAYLLGRRYVVLTATGGVTGSYTLVQGADPLTEFRLGSSGTSIYVDVARSGASVVLAAQTRNQRAIAPAFAALGSANAAYSALTLEPSDAAVRAGLDSLSGEVHSTVLTTMLKDTQAVQTIVRTRLQNAGEGTDIGIWAQGVYRTGTDQDSTAIGLARSNSEGGVGGIDIGLDDRVRVGIAGGYSRTKLYIDSRGSDARLENTHLLGYAGGAWGPITARITIGYAWSDITTRRNVSFTGFSDALSADYDGKTLHGSADIGYKLPFRNGSVEPFAALEAYSVKRDGFVEAGGAAALVGGERQESFTISTVGARLATPVTATLAAHGHLGWRHAFGEVYPSSLMRFASGSVPFRVYGAPLTEDAASASIGLKWTPAANVTVTGGYDGMIGNATDDSRFLLGVAFGL